MLYYFKKTLANTKHDATEVFLRVENHSASTNFSEFKAEPHTCVANLVNGVFTVAASSTWMQLKV